MATTTLDNPKARKALAKFSPAIRDLELPKRHVPEFKADGTVEVPGVPIFAEAKRSLYGQTASWDRDWLFDAAQKNREQIESGYKPPMHFGHHEAGIERRRAGHFRVESVKLAIVENELKWVTFATLVFKDRATFEEAKANWPYRSVEMTPEKPREINSLALLASEAPYHRFPDLAFAAGSVATPISFVWKDKFAMALPKQKDDKAPAEGKPEEKQAPQGDAPANGGAPQAAPKGEPPVKNEAKSDKPGNSPVAGDEGDEDGDEGELATAGAPQGGAQSFDMNAFATTVMGMLNTIVTALVKLSSPGEAYAAARSTPAISAEAQPGAQFTPQAGAEFATLKGQLVAMQAELEKVKKERETEAQLAKFTAELKPYGIPNLETELRAQIAAGTVVPFAAAIKKFAPPTSRASEAPSEPSDPPEVAKFAADPVKLEQARRLFREYSNLPAGHFLKNHTVDRFLAVNLEGN